MPAETHRHGEPVDGLLVLDLIWSLVARPGDPQTPEPGTALRHLGVNGELAILDIWDAATEEFAERTVAEPDVESLFSVTTIGALAEVIARSLRSE